MFRRSLARTSYQTSFAEISFLGLGAFPDTELCPNKKARQKCCTDKSPRVIILCFVFDFWSPSENSSIKIGFFDKEPSENALLRSRLGLLRKGLLITFARPKKKNGTFSGPALPEHGFPVCRSRTKTDESVFCLGPENQFLSPPSRKSTVSDVPAEGCEITVSNHCFVVFRGFRVFCCDALSASFYLSTLFSSSPSAHVFLLVQVGPFRGYCLIWSKYRGYYQLQVCFWSDFIVVSSERFCAHSLLILCFFGAQLSSNFQPILSAFFV